MSRFSKDEYANSLSVLYLHANRFSLNVLNVIDLDTTNITATNGTITNLTSTDATITNLNSTTIDTTTTETGSLSFDPSETLTMSGTASATVSLTYVDASAGGILTIALPGAPPVGMLKMVILRDGPGAIEITGTGLSASVVVTVPNEGALFEWNDDVSEWMVISGPLTSFCPCYSGIITVDPLAVPGPTTFNTITEAIAALDGDVLTGCTIEVAPSTYDEGFEIDAVASTIDTLSIVGDTRAIVGISYVHQVSSNLGSVANGGSGIVTITGWGTTSVTIAMSVTNPDFDAASLVNGDRILVTTSSTVSSERTISNIVNNTFTVSSALPALPASPFGISITILPNRILRPSGPIDNGILYVNANGINVQGFHFDGTSLNAAEFCVFATNGGSVQINNCVVQSRGLSAIRESVITLPTSDTAVCIIGTTGSIVPGAQSFDNSVIRADNVVVTAFVDRGFYAAEGGMISASNIVSTLAIGGGNNTCLALVENYGLLILQGVFGNARNGIRLNVYGRLILGTDTASTIHFIERSAIFLSGSKNKAVSGDIDFFDCQCNQALINLAAVDGISVFGRVRVNPGAGTVFPVLAVRAIRSSVIFTGNAELEANGGDVIQALEGSVVGPALINTDAAANSPDNLVSATDFSRVIFDAASNTLTDGITINCIEGSYVQMPLVSIDGGNQTAVWINCTDNGFVNVVGGTAPTGPATIVSVNTFGTVDATGVAGIAGAISPAAAEDAIVIDNTAIPGFLGSGVKL